ncbi:MAG TPA: Uma2 family endonuclease [Gemmataceae bacterium]|nr:Uma2 family endonuclease [Gemmataceae bacterium]
MATVATQRMTAEEFWEWASRPENQDRRHELEEGVPVEMPSPGELHGVVCALVVHLLWRYVLQYGKGYVCCNDTGLLVQRDPDTVRGPDVILFPDSRPLDEMSRRFAASIPALVVEVLSPNDQMGKVNRRIKQYLRRGVPLVWLVDPDVRIITAYRPGKELYVLEESEEITGEDALPDLRLRVADFFTVPVK